MKILEAEYLWGKQVKTEDVFPWSEDSLQSWEEEEGLWVLWKRELCLIA